MPPSLTVCNTDSLGEQIQRAFPAARLVKALNTVNADVMVDPRIVPGSHTIFIGGNDADAVVARCAPDALRWLRALAPRTPARLLPYS